MHYSTLLKATFDLMATLLPEIELSSISGVLFQATELTAQQSNHKVDE